MSEVASVCVQAATPCAHPATSFVSQAATLSHIGLNPATPQAAVSCVCLAATVRVSGVSSRPEVSNRQGAPPGMSCWRSSSGCRSRLQLASNRM